MILDTDVAPNINAPVDPSGTTTLAIFSAPLVIMLVGGAIILTINALGGFRSMPHR